MSRLILILFVVLFSCENTAREQREFSAYFDADSLVNAQISYLKDKNLTIQKAALLNNVTDTSSYTVDSLLLAYELEIFRKANINKPAFDGLYQKTVDQNNNLIIHKYSPVKDDTELEIKSLILSYENDKLVNLEAFIEEDHWLYKSTRAINLNLGSVDGVQLIDDYSILGYQKMIFRDQVDFSVKGEITPKSL